MAEAMLLILLHQMASFFRDVDSNRAPGDTTTAPDTSMSSKLILPINKLMHQPLSIPRSHTVAYAAAVNVRVIHGKAGIPPASPPGLLPGKIGDVLDPGAETGGANHGTIAATQASFGYRLPMRIIESLRQPFLDTVGIQGTLHAAGHLVELFMGRRYLCRIRLSHGKFINEPVSRFRTCFYKEIMFT